MTYPNPWTTPLVVSSRDEYGNLRQETIPRLPPPLYFWLGADAYSSDWRKINALVSETSSLLPIPHRLSSPSNRPQTSRRL